MEYGNVLGRLRKTYKTVESLIRRNTELEIANRKLREQIDTCEARQAATERVIHTLQT